MRSESFRGSLPAVLGVAAIVKRLFANLSRSPKRLWRTVLLLVRISAPATPSRRGASRRDLGQHSSGPCAVAPLGRLFTSSRRWTAGRLSMIPRPCGQLLRPSSSAFSRAATRATRTRPSVCRPVLTLMPCCSTFLLGCQMRREPCCPLPSPLRSWRKRPGALPTGALRALMGSLPSSTRRTGRSSVRSCSRFSQAL